MRNEKGKVSEMFCERCELEPNTCDKTVTRENNYLNSSLQKRSKDWDSRSRPPRTLGKGVQE